MSVEVLFEPLQLGVIKLRNRIVMAPMTRMRAGAGAPAFKAKNRGVTLRENVRR